MTRNVPDFNLGLNATGAFAQGSSIANQIIENRLHQQQLSQNYDIQNRQVGLQEQEYQQKLQQQQAFEKLASEAFEKPEVILPHLYAKDPVAAARISEGIQQKYSQQYNTLNLLTKDTKAEDKQAVYDILKPELQKQFPELEFGDKYSSELNNSLKTRASGIKAKIKVNNDLRDTAQGIVAFNQFGEGTPTGFNARPYASEGNSGGATGALVKQVMQDNPGMTFTQALQLVQTGFRNNTTIDEKGNIKPIGGALDTKTSIKQAEKLGTDLGEAQAKAKANLGNIEDNSAFLLGQIDELVKHPGLKGSVGLKGGGSLLANIGSDKIIPGTPEADFAARYRQIQGQAFLQAFDTLRGGGQITEVEGKKATEARNRMDTATSEKEFVKAANEFADVVRTGLERQRKQAAGEFGGQIKKPTTKTTGIKFLGFE